MVGGSGILFSESLLPKSGTTDSFDISQAQPVKTVAEHTNIAITTNFLITPDI